jgi:hypothetical protein
LVFLPVLYLSLAGILFYSWLSQTANPPSVVFHALFILSSCTALAVVLAKVRTKIKLLVIISWTLTLQLVNSYVLRLGTDVLSNGPDPLYLQQLVGSILSTGFINFGNGIGAAFEYSFYPTAQTSASMLVLITGASAAAVMKFLPFLSSPIIIILLYSFYCSFVSERDAVFSTLIAASCFWFLYFESTFTQSLFGTLFTCILLLSLTKKRPVWHIVSIISLVALASSHFLSGIYILTILFAAKAYLIVTQKSVNSTLRINLPSTMLLTAATIVLAWLLYPALLLIPFLIVQYIGFQHATVIQFALSRGGTGNPFVTRLIGDIGVVSFAIFLTTGFLHLSIKNRENQLGALLHYSFGGAVLFAVSVLAFTISPFAKDLLPRGFWYVYLISAPIAVYSMNRGWSRITKSLSRGAPQEGPPKVDSRIRFEIKWLLACSLIIMILLSSMYYYYPADRFDNSQPPNTGGYTTVTRLPLEEWVFAGFWTSSHVAGQYVIGGKVVYAFIGGLGRKHVSELPQSGTLSNWIQSNNLRGNVIVLRNSLPEEPEGELVVDANQIQSALNRSNLIYNSGDPLIILLVQ